MVGEVDKFWTCYEGGGFADGVYMEYERKKSKMIPRLWVLSTGKMGLPLIEKKKKWGRGTDLEQKNQEISSGNVIGKMPNYTFKRRYQWHGCILISGEAYD